MLGSFHSVLDSTCVVDLLYRLPILAFPVAAVWIVVHSRVRSRIETYYSARPVPLPRNADSTECSRGEQGLVALMQRKMMSVFSPGAAFNGIPWLPSGDAHTIYASIGDFTKVDVIQYERINLSLSDGGLQALDVTPTFEARPHQPGEPIIFVTHGLTGGSNESYVRATLSALCAPTLEGGLGMRGVVMNSRGCNGSPLTFPQLYNAGSTDDIAHAILWVSKTFPGSRIFGIGFSLGANAITNYAGEESDSCPFSSVISVANPFDFMVSNEHIESETFLGRYIYNYALGGALRALMTRHLKSFLDDPRSKIPNKELEEYVSRRFSTIRDFDEATTKYEFGYASAYDYYGHVSSTRHIRDIRVPYLALNARDDPITGPYTLPICDALTNPWVLLVRTQHGGHLGWFEHGPGKRLQRWYVRPVKEWFGALIDYDTKARPPIEHEEKDGRIVQKGKPSVSIKVLSIEETPPDVPVATQAVLKTVPFPANLLSLLFTGW